MTEHDIESLCGFPKGLAIMLTSACPAACRNCGSSSGAKRHHKLDLSIVKESIKQAKDLGFAKIVFIGGESTLEWNNLLEGLQLSSALGLQPRLVTNGHWAHSIEVAKKRLRELMDNGLYEINYSTGDEHARFVPLEYVVNGITAAAELGLKIGVMVEYSAIRGITKAVVLDHPLLKALPQDQKESIEITESPWMPIDPMAMGCYKDRDVANEDNITLRKGCECILQTYCVEADGQIGVCCGLGIGDIPELYVGTVKDEDFLKKAVESAESDFLKMWIRYKGPEKILAWAAKKNPAIKWQGMYAHNCQACHRIYKDPDVASVIRANYEEMITDVIQSL